MYEVAIFNNDSLDYCYTPPFHPSKKYPEYTYGEYNENNVVYDAVRNIFFMLGLDKNNFNTKDWNPLGDIIQPGNNVLIKPNFVKHTGNPNDIRQMVTHGSIIRAVIDYVGIALKKVEAR